MFRCVLGLFLLLAAAAGAEPQVQQRAVEEIPNGIFIRGGSTVINVDPRCPQGCPEGQTCRKRCDDRPCAADAPPGTVCSACTWQCAD